MHKMIWTVFKTIVATVLIVFLADMIFYLYRVSSLNARMENFAVNLKKTVMDNNYLPSEDADVYREMLYSIMSDYNNVDYAAGSGVPPHGTDDFIVGISWNYSHDANVENPLVVNANRKRFNATSNTWDTVNSDIVRNRMDNPAEYGDVMVVQLRVTVNYPFWGWGNVTADYNNNGQGIDEWVREKSAGTKEFVYTYYVPCMKYKTIS